MSSKNYHITLLIIVLIFWVWSGIGPHDTRLTWVLETAPFMIALPIMLFTYKKFPLTNLTYTLIAIHAMILMLGGSLFLRQSAAGILDGRLVRMDPQQL